MLAAVAVLIGFVAGLMYLGQVRHLKHKIVPTRGLRLPSLEWLQRANSRAIVVSVLMLGVGVLSGMILNLINIRNEAVRLAWNDPVVVSTWLMFFWLLAAAVLSAVYRPARQGRKVAYLTDGQLRLPADHAGRRPVDGQPALGTRETGRRTRGREVMRLVQECGLNMSMLSILIPIPHSPSSPPLRLPLFSLRSAGGRLC